MDIKSCTLSDTDLIFDLYNKGTEHQKKVAKKYWKGFQRALIETEVSEKKIFKIIVDREIACVFSIDYNDPHIWGEKDNDPAMYIHRIATNPSFRGRFFVKRIVEWAKLHAEENQKEYIRMDTGRGNEKLNNYYISCGFDYLGVVELKNHDSLPEHYKDGASSLFQIKL